MKLVRFMLLATLVALLFGGSAAAESRLQEFLGKAQPADLVDGADHFGPVEGTPPTAPVFKGNQLLGFVYLNSDVVDATGYSGKPIRILVALDPAGGMGLDDHSLDLLCKPDQRRALGVPVAQLGASLHRVPPRG